ncbi:MAG: hypothetical protein JW908_12340 [Anaerolineales bacterium]|nr:hypothetical protein [Anaerolineales bacterium]
MAQSDLKELLNTLIPFAQQMLAKQGDYYPFATSIGLDGEIAHIASFDGNEQPSYPHVIEQLTRIIQNKISQGEIKAAGICYDIRTIPPGQKKKSNAIFIGLEHRSGDALEVCLPYKKGFLGKISYGKVFAGIRDRQFFV